MKNLALILISLSIHTIAFGQTISGFSDEKTQQQRELETIFDSQLDAKNLDTWMQFLTSHPHHVGSKQGKANAEYMAALFQQWGYQTEIATYQVLFPTPNIRVLELKGSKPYKALLTEPELKEDNTTNQKSEQLPTYNAYSADGDVTAELVYVNRGAQNDYDELERMGVSVKGKIVIVKYGGVWRGLKPKLAYEHGAVGCIIYSDPQDDGYSEGDVYPNGAFRPKNGVQRGSVMDMPVSPGDPLTPGVAATKEANRLDRSEAKTIMKIPVLPISYEDALPFMQSLAGPVAPPSWHGGLPITYHVGPSVSKAHLKLTFNWDLKPLYDVIAKLPGSEFPDQWVIRGNHHDGWVNGASDPISGMVSELEEARSIGLLAQNGHRPKRTLVYCAWDGEEPALLGSTEWTEDHQIELREKAVLYVNSDGNSRGFIGAGGSHSLTSFFNEIADEVIDPQTNVSIRERRYASEMVGGDNHLRETHSGNKTIHLGALGAGSDWSGFLQYLGISSLNIGFGGEGPGGEYHSIYDTYTHFVRFKDPGFKYGIALSKTAGRIMLRMANAEVLPFQTTSFNSTLSEYIGEIKSLLNASRSETEQDNKMIREGLFELAKDPLKIYQSPKIKDDVPYLNFSNLENELAELNKDADLMAKVNRKMLRLDSKKQQELNLIFYQLERKLTQDRGLPRRSWYKHQIYAPGYYSGYGVKTLPGIREAIEQRNWKEAQENIEIVRQTLQAYDQQLKAALAIINSK